MRKSPASFSCHLLIRFLSHSSIWFVNSLIFLWGSPLSRKALSYLSAFLLLSLCAQISLLSFFPPTFTLTNFPVYSVMRMLLGMHPPKKSLPTWMALYIVHWRRWGTHVFLLSKAPSRSSFPYLCLCRSVYWLHDWHASLCICSEVTDLATWAWRQGLCVLTWTPKTQTSGPRSPAASQREREHMWFHSSKPHSFLICRMGTIISSTLCDSGEG